MIVQIDNERGSWTVTVIDDDQTVIEQHPTPAAICLALSALDAFERTPTGNSRHSRWVANG